MTKNKKFDENNNLDRMNSIRFIGYTNICITFYGFQTQYYRLDRNYTMVTTAWAV